MKNSYNQINSKKDDLYYKMMIIGSKCVGKTQILKRFCKEKFEEKYNPTFGMDFRVQKYFFENITTTVQIIEVSGNNAPPHELLKDYLLDADGFLCVYDISRRESVNELNNLISDYERIMGTDNNNNNNNINNNNNNNKQCWYFIGNKCDIVNRECPSNPADIFDYTPLGTIGFIEISAKNNKFIDNMFNNVIFQIKNNKRKAKNNTQIINSNKLPTIKTKIENKQLIDTKETKSHCHIF